MKKIIFAASFLLLLAGAFLFWNSQRTVIADDKDGKCCNTECPKYADCDKKCDKQCDKQCDSLKSCCKKECDKKSEECVKKCETKSEECMKKCETKSEECRKQCSPKNEGQSQMNNCQQKPGCETKKDGTQTPGKCPMQKQQ